MDDNGGVGNLGAYMLGRFGLMCTLYLSFGYFTLAN